MSRQPIPGARALAAEKAQAARMQASRDNAALYQAMSQIVPSFDAPISYNGLVLNNAVVQQIVAEHCEGTFINSGRLSDALLTDSRISSLMDIAFSNVVQILLDPSQQRLRPSSVGGSVATECYNWWKEHLWGVLDLSVLEEITRDVELMGYYIGQVRYDKWQPKIERWHPSLCYYNRFERNFRLYALNNASEPVMPGQGKWILYSPYSEYLSWMHGGVSRLAKLFLLKLYCLRDWGRYGTVYGNQVKTLGIPYGATTEQKSSMIRELQNMQSESILPMYKGRNRDESFDFNLVGPAPGTADVFEKLVAYCDREEAIYLLGQDTTSDKGGGAYKSVESIWDATTMGKARVRILGITNKLIPQVIKSITKIMWGTDAIAPTLSVGLESIAYQSQSAHAEQNREVQRPRDVGTDVATENPDV